LTARKRLAVTPGHIITKYALTQKLFRGTPDGQYSHSDCQAAGHPEEFSLLLSSADFEISTAAAVYPNPIPANAPGAPLDARRITTLAHQSYSGANTLAAPVAFHVARLAVNGLNITAAITIAIASSAILARRAG
jgi:hypothetical protein